MKTTYDLACALEDGLDSVEKLARALMMMAETLGEESEPIIEVARHIRNVPDYSRPSELSCANCCSRTGTISRLPASTAAQ
jgi:hypothetical protein